MALTKYVQGDPHRFALRGWHTRGKHVLVSDTTAGGIARSCHRRKRYFPRFPAEGMCVGTGGQSKGNKVSWNVVWLDDIIRVAILKVSPTTKLNVQLATGALCANTVPGD